MPRVALDILTGFLGSGKTSLLRHVLETGLDGRRVAVVVNEIGEIGVDGASFEGLEIERMVELSSGCVCCQINHQFTAAVGEILETVKPDLIVIETTGLADPLNLARDAEATGLMVDAIITVVDAEKLPEHLAAAQVTEHQIRNADYLILNKLDLASKAQVKDTRARLKKMNRRAPVFDTTRGKLTHTIPFATSARAYRDRIEAGGDHHHLARDDFSAFTWRAADAVDQDRFEKVLRSLPANVYRAKGIVQLAGASWPSLFSFASGRFELRWIRLPGARALRSEGVFIGRDLDRVRPKIEKSLARALAGESS